MEYMTKSVDDFAIIKEIADINKMVDKGVINVPLTQLKFVKLRGFAENTTINFFFPLTIIAGKNGYGKTTILRSIELLALKQGKQSTLFETVIDDANIKETEISAITNSAMIKYNYSNKGEWTIVAPVSYINPNVEYIQTKRMIGSIEKALLFDDVGKHESLDDKARYIQKASKKIIQNKNNNSSKKKRCKLDAKQVGYVNDILEEELENIEIIEHKYFNGTWGQSSIFYTTGCKYSEYNAGSGEHIVALLVHRVEGMKEGGILLMDEPETSLHPGVQKRLMKYILGVIKRKKIQVIICSHSPVLVEEMPSEMLKVLKKNNDGKITIEENVYYQNVFLNLEYDNFTKKIIIVEDSMAKMILEKIIDMEGWTNILDVRYYPGGASNIKKNIILPYAKTEVDNHFVIFDGDQFCCRQQDYSEVLEKDKTIDFYQNEVKAVVGINANSFEWGVDANRKSGREDDEQKIKLMQSYLEFYRRNVFFLPEKIPEDIIFSDEELKQLFGNNLEELLNESDSKLKLYNLCEEKKFKYESLLDILIYKFCEKKQKNYQTIKEILEKIIER